MLQLVHRLPGTAVASETLHLTFEQRCRGKQRVHLDSGREGALMLERGVVLHDGDCLRSQDGLVVRVLAAKEKVSVVRSANPQGLLRVAYHLSKRQISVQVGTDFVSYLHDPVLDDLVTGLGAQVSVELCAFEPEPGAYAHWHGHERESSPPPALGTTHS